MAYRFKKTESLSNGIRRVFQEEIAWAVGQLAHSKKHVEAIHEARKSIKKLRGLLSLVAQQPGLPTKAEDRYFRDAARLLSGFRDNDVISETFDLFAAKHPEFDHSVCVSIRRTLRSDNRVRNDSQVRAEVVKLLEQAQERGKTWPLPEDIRFEDVLPAIENTYRKGRKALARARKTADSEQLHEFRKEVKEHWYHLRLCEDFVGAGRTHDLDDLAKCLGDDHNLLVLRQHLEAEAETRSDRVLVRPLLHELEQESYALRHQALESGAKLYAEKAGEYGARLRELCLPKTKRQGPSALRAKSAVA